MAQQMALSAPLSGYAKKKLWDIREDVVTVTALMPVIFLAILMFVAMVYSKGGSIPFDGRGFAMFVGVVGGLFVVVMIIIWGRHVIVSPERKAKILEENSTDYAQAECLRAQIFPRFAGVRSDEFPLRESAITGSWRAFKVEHFVSQSLRGDITGNVCLDVRSFFMGDGRVNAQIKQLAVPDLLDMSSVVFFENDQGETLRVLVPSPRATKETLARLIEMYVGKHSNNRYYHGSLSEGTHVHDALKQFTADESSLLHPISHPMILDRLDAATHRPVEARPVVQVIGETVQDGVALATALVVSGLKSTFFPSGYLGELASGIAFTLDRDRKPDNLLEAVR